MTQSEIRRWRFRGDFFESCNCEVNCPCVFGSPAHYDRCDLTQVWRISTGHYGDVPLDGLHFALVARTPKLMSDGNWETAIYIDERASLEQREALKLITSGDAGGGFARRKALTGSILGVRYVPIALEVVGKRRRAVIPGTLEMEVEAVPGARANQEVKLANNPLSRGRGNTAWTIARAIIHKFSDHGLSWDNTGMNGYYYPVSMSGP